MTGDDSTELNVVGTFADMEAARDAMTSVGRYGVEGDKVSLQAGDDADAAARDADTTSRDKKVVSDIGRTAGLGVAAGSVVGGALGLAAGAVAFGAPDLTAVAAGMAAGGAVGGVTSGVASIDLSDDWELTYQSDGDGRTQVQIRTNSREEADKAAAALRHAHAENIEYLDSEGRPTAA